MKNSIKISIMSLVLVVLISAAIAIQSSNTVPAVGTTESLGAVDGIEIEVKVQGPSAQDTPLQILCVFEYTEGDIYNSPPALLLKI